MEEGRLVLTHKTKSVCFKPVDTSEVIGKSIFSFCFGSQNANIEFIIRRVDTYLKIDPKKFILSYQGRVYAYDEQEGDKNGFLEAYQLVLESNDKIIIKVIERKSNQNYIHINDAFI